MLRGAHWLPIRLTAKVERTGVPPALDRVEETGACRRVTA